MTIISKTIRIMKQSALMVLSLGVSAKVMSEASSEPANFDFEPHDLISVLNEQTSKQFDEMLGEDSFVVVYCQSDIDTDGSVMAIQCYEQQAGRQVDLQTEQAIRLLAFTPARVDGETIPVRMRFRVAYRQTESGLKATALPNLGTMQAQYGRDYVAPQERLDTKSWHDRYAKRSMIRGDNFFTEGEASRIGLMVSANGRVNQVRTLEVERAFNRDAQIAKEAIKRARFIPGKVRDKDMPMNYVAVLSYQERGEAVSQR